VAVSVHASHVSPRSEALQPSLSFFRPWVSRKCPLNCPPQAYQEERHSQRFVTSLFAFPWRAGAESAGKLIKRARPGADRSVLQLQRLHRVPLLQPPTPPYPLRMRAHSI